MTVPENTTVNNDVNPNPKKVKDNFSLIKPNNSQINHPIHSTKRISALQLAQIKIPLFEWKIDSNIYLKNDEYYLNIYYYHLSHNNPNEIENNKKDTKDTVTTKEETLINKIEDLPFLIKQNSLSKIVEEKVIQILKKLIIFQDVSPDILSVMVSDMALIRLPEGKTVFDANDEGNFFYIISKGKVSVKVGEKDLSELSRWQTFGEISLFKEKKREEVIITKEETDLFVIDGDSFRDIQTRNNEIILKEKYNFLNNIFLFGSLDKISKYNIAQKIKKKEFAPNTKIITEGEIGDKLYMIKEGIVSCRIGHMEIRRLSNNEYFGQNSILIDVKRGANIISLQNTICYELSKDDLKEALTNDYINVILFCFFKKAIEKNNNLKNIIIDSHLQEVFNCFSIQQYARNEYIYDPDIKNSIKSKNKKLVLIIEGSLFNSEKSLVADRGKFLGEELFNDINKGISDDIYAKPDAITFEADIFEIAKIMKLDLIKDDEKTLNNLRAINKLKKIYLFRNLSDNTLESIALGMKKQKFKPNEFIIKEDTEGDLFYLIIKGRVRITVKGNYVRDLDSGDCLGENALLTEKELRTASAMALDKVLCYVLSKNEFQVILNDNNTKEYLMKKLAFQDTEISLSSLNFIKFLGQGKLSSVSLVHNNKNIYAIKAISRKRVEREKTLAKYLVNERKLMLSLEHPFIVKMVKSLKNKHFCFFLVEFINGINLGEYLTNRESKQNKYETQFYIGSILLMLEYLQKKYIAHRDIKPSNIMIDQNGYLKLINFDSAKVIKDYTSTIIGTPHYIAPEILQGNGYSLSCDFWSLGICAFEIFYGKYPFGNKVKEVIEIYREILKNKFVFPCESSKVDSVNNFIKCLLNKKISERICNINSLKKKSFFEGFDFNQLNDFKLKAPYKPKKQSYEKYLKDTNPYENYVKEDNTKVKRKRKDNREILFDYKPNWADEF